MSNKVNKTGTSAVLLRELASLRKGSGLQPHKLAGTPVLLGQLAKVADEHADTLTLNQAFNLLLAEISKLPESTPHQALHSAYGLTSTSVHLSDRRAELAGTLQKHPDTIERYENEALRQLAASLTRTRRTKGSAFDDASSRTGLSELQAMALRQAASYNLAGMMDLPEHADKLTRYLQSACPPYFDASVLIKLTESARGPGWYRYHMHYRFTGIRRRFRVAIVFKPEDGEQLMTSGLVDEYCVINDNTTPRREARNIINATSLVANHPTTGHQHKMTFATLDDFALEDLYASLDTPLTSPCWVIQTMIPAKWQSHDVMYEYQTAFDLKQGVPCAYWYAPRMMYLRSLEWDFTRFPKAETYRYKIQPFLGNAVGATYSRHDHKLIFRPNNWIMPAHGVCLVWYQTPAAASTPY